ncbi:MAG: aliphatic sulfonate ABC transporter substrate-binding protein [Firmicutes bacterium]|jgi:NitT/TauT family transport system substrate-binding protein|nr:aliphatic sulfonate ABC transporter substrate-binding protein [Bacillota bacterium]MCL5992983.1 aliphatic sulfonate ABC transporter substrate-binding protein [Bacillota bacterium]
MKEKKVEFGVLRGLRLSKGWMATVGLLLAFALTFGVLAGCGGRENGQATNAPTGGDEKLTIRLGYFPNITHIQAMVGQNDGTFQKALGEQVEIEEKIFNAGPKLIQALLTGEIDLGYIGPVPAINGYVVSNKSLRIIAGASNEGAILVAGKGANIKNVEDLAGKKVAVPQLAGTQDLTLRRLMKEAGLKDASRGGTVTVIPAENPDILTLIARGEVDAALVPEPWGSRIIKETGASVVLEADQLWKDGSYATAVVIATTEFLAEQPELVEKWLAAHVELTQRINNDPESYKQIFNKQFEKLTGKTLPQDVLDSSFRRLLVTYDPEITSITDFVTLKVATGYLEQEPDISQLLDLAPLNRVLRDQGLAEVK